MTIISRTSNPGFKSGVTAPVAELMAALSTQRRDDAPGLSVDHCDTGWWLCDRGRPIAYIHRAWFTLDVIAFAPDSAPAHRPVLNPNYDMGTAMNTFIELLQPVEGNHRGLPAESSVTWSATGPDMLRLDIRAHYSRGEITENTLQVAYDPAVGQYLYRLTKQLSQASAARIEFCNVYPVHLGHGSAECKRWQHTVWTDRCGALRRMPHNSALPCLMPSWKHLRDKWIAPGGFIGWGVEQDFNPVMLIEHASADVVAGTCDQWFDEHLVFSDPPGGRASATLRLVNAPARFMEQVVRQAEPMHVDADEIATHSGPAFLVDRVNDLESPVDPNVTMVGQIWPIQGPVRLDLEKGDERRTIRAAPGEHVIWAKDVGHSGRRSIRLTGSSDGRLLLGALGQNFFVTPGARYRFDGWIRTQGAAAGLRLSSNWRNWVDHYEQVESPIVAADSDWTHVSVELGAGRYPYMRCRLMIDGPGCAWFDDLRFTRVDTPGA